MSPTRRRLLGVLGASVLAGCTDSGSPGTNTSQPPTHTTVPTTAESKMATHSDIDERVKTKPPGEPPVSASGSWPQLGFDAGNTGYSPNGTGLREAEETWVLDAGGTAAMADGTLYNLDMVGDDTTGLVGRDPSTAETRTETPLVPYGVSSPPTLVSGRAFVNTFIEVFCCDADTGEVLWRGPEMDGIQGAPAVADGRVFVNSGGFKSVPAHLRGFDIETGEELWRYDTESETKSTPAVVDGVVYVAAIDGLHAVDAETGERVFHVPEAGERWTNPVVADGRVYVQHHDAGLSVVDATDGSTLWTGPETGSEPVVTSASVFVESDDGLQILDPADGTDRRDSTPWTPSRPLAVVGDVLYAASGGTIEGIDAVTGEELWYVSTPEVQVTDVVRQGIYGITPVDGVVYAKAADGFHAFAAPQ
ncbi:PQQ-binding-like beta-propeller repeat protein [Haloarchaeobius sp. DFWS5]|uniref:outer membrane protein assembly factor BamB family protein n=1 Tax=Haloarchaeobius sp. DFWS5 TaxID=3446114 RepID=UPI003EBE9F07